LSGEILALALRKEELQKPVSPSMLYDMLMNLFGLAEHETSSLSKNKKENHSHDARGIRILLVED
jgi:hypothetical protein